MPVDAPVIERDLGDRALREQFVAQGTQDEHFGHEVHHKLGQGHDGDRKLAGSLPNISSTTRRSIEQCFRNWRHTERFRIGYLRDCVGSMNRSESGTSLGEDDVSASSSEQSVRSVKSRDPQVHRRPHGKIWRPWQLRRDGKKTYRSIGDE